jgi:hypothetical protein
MEAAGFFFSPLFSKRQYLSARWQSSTHLKAVIFILRTLCEISVSHSGVVEHSGLLGVEDV